MWADILRAGVEKQNVKNKSLLFCCSAADMKKLGCYKFCTKSLKYFVKATYCKYVSTFQNHLQCLFSLIIIFPKQYSFKYSDYKFSQSIFQPKYMPQKSYMENNETINA